MFEVSQLMFDTVFRLPRYSQKFQVGTHGSDTEKIHLPNTNPNGIFTGEGYTLAGVSHRRFRTLGVVPFDSARRDESNGIYFVSVSTGHRLKYSPGAF